MTNAHLLINVLTVVSITDCPPLYSRGTLYLNSYSKWSNGMNRLQKNNKLFKSYTVAVMYNYVFINNEL